MKKLAAAAAVLVMAAAPVAAVLILLATSSAIPAQAGCTTAEPLTGAWRPPFRQAYTLTSPFGPRADPITGIPRRHTGQDLVSLPGPGPVVAASAGTVTVGSDPGGYGSFVTIDHGAGITTLYAHLASIAAGITTGARVWAGEELGVEGSSGHSTGYHLHFEIRDHGTPIDPVPFMLAHGAPLNGRPVPSASPPGAAATDPGGQQGGIGFPLPDPGTPRLASLNDPPLPIPAHIKADYLAAADRYHLPWTLLAGIGMEETGHGRATATSSAGARGLMQFMPATWARYGVDGDGDGIADIGNDADSAMSAANYLTASGVTTGGAGGVRRAIFAYNHATWYVNDVLYYAHAYGGGTIAGDPADCGPAGDGDPSLPPIDAHRIQAMLAWADSHIGDPYVFGANGPHAWDCSSFTQAAYARIGITMPRTASAQRDWLAHGHGHRVPPARNNPATCSSSTPTSAPTSSATS